MKKIVVETHQQQLKHAYRHGGSLSGVVVNVLNSDIVVSGFELP